MTSTTYENTTAPESDLRRRGIRIGDLLFEMNANSRTTIVLVTHDNTLASRCGRILRMQAGGLVQ